MFIQKYPSIVYMEIYIPYIVGGSISSILGGISYYWYSDNLTEEQNNDEINCEKNENTDKNLIHEYSLLDDNLKEEYYSSNNFRKDLGTTTTNKFESIVEILNKECNRKAKLPINNNKKQRQKLFRYIQDYEKIGHYMFIHKYKKN